MTTAEKIDYCRRMDFDKTGEMEFREVYLDMFESGNYWV